MEADRLNGLEMTSVLLVLIGGLNWLLIGLFDFNLVTAIFGEASVLSRVIFAVVGVAAVHVAVFGPKLRRVRGSENTVAETR